MLTVDDLARAARIALDRVESVTDCAATDPDCRVYHLDVAQAGVEEGLKLAMLVLHQQAGPIWRSDPDRMADESRELPCPRSGVSHSSNER